MFLAMASSVLSASTFDVPLLKYLRNCISYFKAPKEPSACILRFVLKRIPSSERIRSKSSLKNKKNLTHEHEQKFQGINIADLPLEQAIKHVRGNGQRKLYLFSDPLCSYCQQLEQQMTSVQDVTVYLFLLPLRNIHPQSEEIATRNWSSPHQFETWENYDLHRQLPKA